MVSKTDYSSEAVEAARSVMIELVHMLGEYREHMVLIGGCANENNLPDWSIGPFQRYQGNPVLEPVDNAWDSSFVIAPTIIVKDDKFYMIYRGIEKPWDQRGVDAIGLAISKDGKNWQRHPANPIIYSTNTITKICKTNIF